MTRPRFQPPQPEGLHISLCPLSACTAVPPADGPGRGTWPCPGLRQVEGIAGSLRGWLPSLSARPWRGSCNSLQGCAVPAVPFQTCSAVRGLAHPTSGPQGERAAVASSRSLPFGCAPARPSRSHLNLHLPWLTGLPFLFLQPSSAWPILGQCKGTGVGNVVTFSGIPGFHPLSWL